jgi:O-methyltransferase involved in polyketide biosynthesis
VNNNLDKNPEMCFGKGYPNAAKKAETVMRLAAKVGEPWISFYSAEEMKQLLSKHGFSLIENKTLADLNSEYFAPVGRALSKNQIFNLEHSVVAKSKKA